MTLAPCQMPVPAFDRPLLLPCGCDDEDDEDVKDEENHLYQPLHWSTSASLMVKN